MTDAPTGTATDAEVSAATVLALLGAGPTASREAVLRTARDGRHKLAATLLSLWASGRDLWRGRWHPFTTMLLANALAMVFLPQSTYREFLAMLRLTTGLMATTILYGAARRSKRILNYTLLWLASLVFLAKEGPVP